MNGGNAAPTMRFRPLCIDYHSRAQEIVATKRDVQARRTALRTLPNPSSPSNNRQNYYSQSDDDVDDLHIDGGVSHGKGGVSGENVVCGSGGNDENDCRSANQQSDARADHDGNTSDQAMEQQVRSSFFYLSDF